MKKIILHVGSGKTGSTSIQHALFESKHVNDDTIKYPNLLNHKSNQIFRFAFCPSSDTPSNIKGKYENDSIGYAEYQDEIKKAFAEDVSGYNTVIISSEFLFLSSKSEVNKIKIFLNDLGFTEIHVIMYLRPPSKYYLSVAQQALKNQSKMPTPDRFRYNLIRAIDNWNTIKPASLTVKEFDRNELYQGDVVKDIELYINSKLGEPIHLNSVKQKNETMSVEGTVILQEYFKVLDKCNFRYDLRMKYIQRAREFVKIATVGSKPVLKVDIENYINLKYKNEIEDISSRYNIFNDIVNISKVNVDYSFDKNKMVDFFDIVTKFDIEEYLSLKTKF